ncbi:MAG: TetR/AcrR family transcriptional regulator [Candidatus Omnitrophota bacterium]
MKNALETKEFSLREKKHAKTRLAIMNAFMERLLHTRFEDISIKEVCKDAEVAEGTFFNYFPEKINVIAYYLYLTTMKIIWKAQQACPAGKYLPLIDSVLEQMSGELKNNNIVYQILSVLIAQSERPKRIMVSSLEKSLAFPDCDGIEHVSSVILDDWLKECVVSAIDNGELPKETNADDVVVSLMTIICGTLLAIRFNTSNSREYHYMRQLQALWRVLGVRGG